MPNDNGELDNQFLINPELMLKNRFGKSYEHIKNKIPLYGILSFFNNSISNIEKNYKESLKYSWLGESVEIIFFKHQHLPVCLVTLPFGANLASMVLEELIFCGVQHFISIGFSASLTDSIKPHSIVIPSESLKEEGIAHLYSSENKFAIASTQIIHCIDKALSKKKTDYITGPCWSIASPYRESLRKINDYSQNGILCVDMESASLFAIAEYYNIQLASLFSISDYFKAGTWFPHFKDKEIKTRKRFLLEIALESLYIQSLENNIS